VVGHNTILFAISGLNVTLKPLSAQQFANGGAQQYSPPLNALELKCSQTFSEKLRLVPL